MRPALPTHRYDQARTDLRRFVRAGLVTPNPHVEVNTLVPHADLTDAQIVHAVLSGDVERFAILVNRYQNNYARFAVRMLGSRADADDVLQQAFLRAWRKLAECRDPSNFGAWLYQIVANECYTYAARRERRLQRFVHNDELLERKSIESEEPDTLLQDEIQRALGSLDGPHREAFILKHVEELTYEEMAELTGVGVSALKMRVKRACSRLRQLLNGVAHV